MTFLLKKFLFACTKLWISRQISHLELKSLIFLNIKLNGLFKNLWNLIPKPKESWDIGKKWSGNPVGEPFVCPINWGLIKLRALCKLNILDETIIIRDVTVISRYWITIVHYSEEGYSKCCNLSLLMYDKVEKTLCQCTTI